MANSNNPKNSSGSNNTQNASTSNSSRPPINETPPASQGECTPYRRDGADPK